MESKLIQLHGKSKTVYSDGSIGYRKKGSERDLLTFGSKCSNGYRQVNFTPKKVLVHRLVAMAFLPEYSEDLFVDHIDGNRSNNDVSNLRMVTRSGNHRGHVKQPKGKSSKYRGVIWNKRYEKWLARCSVYKKQIQIGTFDDEREAAIARDAYVHSIGYPLEGLNFPENFCPVDASE
jgi:hypothetical protein